MILTSKLIVTADTYCRAASTSRGAVGNRIFSDGKRFDAIAGGADLNTRSFERAMLWFSSNWPEGLDWPEGIDRPEPERDEPARVADQAGAAA